MPPKVKITKEDIIKTSLELIKKYGVESVNARTIAKELNCSTQPIFSNFSSMNDLMYEVLVETNNIYEGYLKREIENKEYPIYKATGMAYIRFAKEEKELFKFLFMRDRKTEAVLNKTDFGSDIMDIISNSTGLKEDKAKLFHLEMWILGHGIATMFATSFLNLEWDLVSQIMTDAYKGLMKQYGLE